MEVVAAVTDADSPVAQENNPRTFKEVLAVVPEASKKDVNKCYTFIVKGLDDVVRRSLPIDSPEIRHCMHRRTQQFVNIMCKHSAACLHHGSLYLRLCVWPKAFMVLRGYVLLPQGGSSVNPADFIPRFSSHLLLKHTDTKVRQKGRNKHARHAFAAIDSVLLSYPHGRNLHLADRAQSWECVGAC